MPKIIAENAVVNSGQMRSRAPHLQGIEMMPPRRGVNVANAEQSPASTGCQDDALFFCKKIFENFLSIGVEVFSEIGLYNNKGLNEGFIRKGRDGDAR